MSRRPRRIQRTARSGSFPHADYNASPREAVERNERPGLNGKSVAEFRLSARHSEQSRTRTISTQRISPQLFISSAPRMGRIHNRFRGPCAGSRVPDRGAGVSQLLQVRLADARSPCSGRTTISGVPVQGPEGRAGPIPRQDSSLDIAFDVFTPTIRSTAVEIRKDTVAEMLVFTASPAPPAPPFARLRSWIASVFC